MEAQTISEWVCIENVIVPGPQECAVPAFLAAAVPLHHSPEWCAVLWTWLHSASHTVSCQMWEGFGAQSGRWSGAQWRIQTGALWEHLAAEDAAVFDRLTRKALCEYEYALKLWTKVKGAICNKAWKYYNIFADI